MKNFLKFMKDINQEIKVQSTKLYKITLKSLKNKDIKDIFRQKIRKFVCSRLIRLKHIKETSSRYCLFKVSKLKSYVL